MPSKFTTVFLSSTSRDLQEHRDAACDAINRLGYRCVRMEDFGARDREADAFCRNEVGKCDLFVGVLGHFYGSCPQGSGQSYTEREYDAAVKSNRSRLLFFADESSLPPIGLTELEENARKQLAFRKRAGEDRIRDKFTLPDDLASKVVSAIHNWEREPATIAHSLFEHGVKVVDFGLFERPAPADEIKRYYCGAPLSWNIVAAGGLVTRDCLASLVEKLRTPGERARMFCIVGEPGAGKSSFAYQTARALCESGQGPILWFPSAPNDPSIVGLWQRLDEFFKRLSRPFYLFVDDVFHNDTVFHFLQNHLDTNLPVTMLATSRSKRFRANFTFPIERIDLLAPSLTEKQNILRKLGKRWEDLNWNQREELKKANSFLILMYMLNRGGGEQKLEEIVQETLRRLKSDAQDVYNAYRYICFTWQFEVSIPRSVVERLVRGWRYEDLLRHDASQGLIFEDVYYPNHLRALHPVLAERTVNIMGWNPGSLFDDLAAAIHTRETDERRHFVHLVLELARGPERMRPANLREAVRKSFESLQREATIGEMTLWHDVFILLGVAAEPDRCADIAFTRQPAGQDDWRGLIMLCLKRRPPAGMFVKLREWLKDNPREWLFRSLYLRAIRKHGINEIGSVLDETSAWLDEHPQDFYVREHYIGLVSKRGSDEQVRRAIVQTAAWLASQPAASSIGAEAQVKADSQVRTAYLALLRNRGTDLQANLALDETRVWLAANADDLHVRQGYLGLVKKRADLRRVADVIDETEAWLAAHEHDRTVRHTFLMLVKDRGTDKQAASAIEQTRAWLLAHPSDNNILIPYKALIERRGTPRQAK